MELWLLKAWIILGLEASLLHLLLWLNILYLFEVVKLISSCHFLTLVLGCLVLGRPKLLSLGSIFVHILVLGF
jgi:hypothetical protein